MKNPLLSTEEKRRWLARVFRDEDGEYSQADKFKALVEDTKLAALQQEEEEFKRQREMGAAPQDPILALLQSCLLYTSILKTPTNSIPPSGAWPVFLPAGWPVRP